MATITFHSMAASAYLWTAQQIADEKGVTHTLCELTPGSAEHLRLHPFGKMPVLRHGEVVLYETLAIAHYIDRAFPGPALQPADARGQADVLRWISIVNAYVFPVMNRFMKERLVRPAFGFDPDIAFLESAAEPLSLQVRLIDEAVGRAGYLAGADLTIADCFLLPHLLFFAITPEGHALLADAPKAADWLERMTARDSFRQSAQRIAYESFLRTPAPTTPLWSSV